MKTIYKCDICEREFGSSYLCQSHEASHFDGVERIKYELHIRGKEPCDYCANSYYVYGCEQDCEYPDCNCDNNHKDFVPNKKAHGGV